MSDIHYFIADERGKSQHRIDDSPCFSAFTGVEEFAGEPRMSLSPRFAPTLASPQAGGQVGAAIGCRLRSRRICCRREGAPS